MIRKSLAVLFGALLILSAIMSVYSTVALPQPRAFTPEEIVVPSEYDMGPLQPIPDIESIWPHSPDVSVLISIGRLYEDYGGSIRVTVNNNDTARMFLEAIAFEWTGSGRRAEQNVHKYIDANGSLEIKAIAVPGPSTSGERNYRLSIKLLMERSDGWYRIGLGNDDWVDFSQHTYEVQELAQENDYDITNNFRLYYKKVNNLVDTDSKAVESAAENATAGLGQGFNMAKACAIFDYLDENCVYTEDEGGDSWYSPDQLLEQLEGDCEDYAMLIGAMVTNVGGTARVYLTTDHAFAAVYAGTELNQVAEDIREYYQADLSIHYMQDETGYWIVMDPLGSFYAGGLAVGQAPTQEYGGGWNTTFEESDNLHALDITGQDLTVPIWMEPNFWMGMILVFGFFTIMGLLSGGKKHAAPKTMCHICAGEIGKDLYTCPKCKTTYHTACAHENAYCHNCQSPIFFPPPPNRP